MEALILKTFEDSIVSGAFLFLLYYVTQQNKKSMDTIASQSNEGFKEVSTVLSSMNTQLTTINQTVTTFDSRLSKLEDNKE